MTLRLTSQTLPIDGHKDEICKAIVDNDVIVLTSPTGSGKTVRLPKFALSVSPNSKMLVVLPRQMNVEKASKVYEEFCKGVGKCYYMVNTIKDNTDIIVTTYAGLLLRFEDLTKPDNLIVMLDEIHERTAEMDAVITAMKIKLQLAKLHNSSMKLILTSATISDTFLTEYFRSLRYQKIEIDVEPRFPISQHFLTNCPATYKYAQDSAVDVLGHMCDLMNETRKYTNVLIFVPGEPECATLFRLCTDSFSKKPYKNMFAFATLHSRCQADYNSEADAVHNSRDKYLVTISTNIAESGITFPDVGLLIDIGYEKVMMYDTETRSTSLTCVKTSNASAIQRMGRVGRTCPGVCYRMYSIEDAYKRKPYLTPEVNRVWSGDWLLKYIKVMETLKYSGPDMFDELPTLPSSSLLMEGLCYLFLHLLIRGVFADQKTWKLSPRGNELLLISAPVRDAVAIVKAKKRGMEWLAYLYSYVKENLAIAEIYHRDSFQKSRDTNDMADPQQSNTNSSQMANRNTHQEPMHHLNSFFVDGYDENGNRGTQKFRVYELLDTFGSCTEKYMRAKKVIEYSDDTKKKNEAARCMQVVASTVQRIKRQLIRTIHYYCKGDSLGKSCAIMSRRHREQYNAELELSRSGNNVKLSSILPHFTLDEHRIVCDCYASAYSHNLCALYSLSNHVCTLSGMLLPPVHNLDFCRFAGEAAVHLELAIQRDGCRMKDFVILPQPPSYFEQCRAMLYAQVIYNTEMAISYSPNFEYRGIVKDIPTPEYWHNIDLEKLYNNIAEIENKPRHGATKRDPPPLLRDAINHIKSSSKTKDITSLKVYGEPEQEEQLDDYDLVCYKNPKIPAELFDSLTQLPQWPVLNALPVPANMMIVKKRQRQQKEDIYKEMYTWGEKEQEISKPSSDDSSPTMTQDPWCTPYRDTDAEVYYDVFGQPQFRTTNPVTSQNMPALRQPTATSTRHVDTKTEIIVEDTPPGNTPNESHDEPVVFPPTTYSTENVIEGTSLVNTKAVDICSITSDLLSSDSIDKEASASVVNPNTHTEQKLYESAKIDHPVTSAHPVPVATQPATPPYLVSVDTQQVPQHPQSLPVVAQPNPQPPQPVLVATHLVPQLTESTTLMQPELNEQTNITEDKDFYKYEYNNDSNLYTLIKVYKKKVVGTSGCKVIQMPSEFKSLSWPTDDESRDSFVSFVNNYFSTIPSLAFELKGPGRDNKSMSGLTSHVAIIGKGILKEWAAQNTDFILIDDGNKACKYKHSYKIICKQCFCSMTRINKRKRNQDNLDIASTKSYARITFSEDTRTACRNFAIMRFEYKHYHIDELDLSLSVRISKSVDISNATEIENKLIAVDTKTNHAEVKEGTRKVRYSTVPTPLLFIGWPSVATECSNFISIFQESITSLIQAAPAGSIDVPLFSRNIFYSWASMHGYKYYVKKTKSYHRTGTKNLISCKENACQSSLVMEQCSDSIIISSFSYEHNHNPDNATWMPQSARFVRSNAQFSSEFAALRQRLPDDTTTPEVLLKRYNDIKIEPPSKKEKLRLQNEDESSSNYSSVVDELEYSAKERDPKAMKNVDPSERSDILIRFAMFGVPETVFDELNSDEQLTDKTMDALGRLISHITTSYEQDFVLHVPSTAIYCTQHKAKTNSGNSTTKYTYQVNNYYQTVDNIKYPKAFIFLNLRGEHWVLCLADFTKKQILYYDPLLPKRSTLTKPLQKIVLGVFGWGEGDIGDVTVHRMEEDIEEKDHEFIEQHDDCSCGVYCALLLMRHLFNEIVLYSNVCTPAFWKDSGRKMLIRALAKNDLDVTVVDTLEEQSNLHED